MRLVQSLTLVALIGGIASGHFQAQAADTMFKGWDMFKFGMTIDQARAIPGIIWEPSFARTDRSGKQQPGRLMDSRAANVDGLSYLVILVFDAQLQLTEFTATHVDRDIDHCEPHFQAILTSLETGYGAFMAPQGPLMQSASGSKRSVRSLPGGRSQYSYETENLDAQAGSLSGSRPHSRAVAATDRLTVLMDQPAEPESCHLAIFFGFNHTTSDVQRR